MRYVVFENGDLAKIVEVVNGEILVMKFTGVGTEAVDPDLVKAIIEVNTIEEIGPKLSALMEDGWCPDYYRCEHCAADLLKPGSVKLVYKTALAGEFYPKPFFEPRKAQKSDARLSLDVFTQIDELKIVKTISDLELDQVFCDECGHLLWKE